MSCTQQQTWLAGLSLNKPPMLEHSNIKKQPNSPQRITKSTPRTPHTCVSSFNRHPTVWSSTTARLRCRQRADRLSHVWQQMSIIWWWILVSTFPVDTVRVLSVTYWLNWSLLCQASIKGSAHHPTQLFMTANSCRCFNRCTKMWHEWILVS